MYWDKTLQLVYWAYQMSFKTSIGYHAVSSGVWIAHFLFKNKCCHYACPNQWLVIKACSSSTSLSMPWPCDTVLHKKSTTISTRKWLGGIKKLNSLDKFYCLNELASDQGINFSDQLAMTWQCNTWCYARKVQLHIHKERLGGVKKLNSTQFRRKLSPKVGQSGIRNSNLCFGYRGDTPIQQDVSGVSIQVVRQPAVMASQICSAPTWWRSNWKFNAT